MEIKRFTLVAECDTKSSFSSTGLEATVTAYESSTSRRELTRFTLRLSGRELEYLQRFLMGYLSEFAYEPTSRPLICMASPAVYPE